MWILEFGKNVFERKLTPPIISYTKLMFDYFSIFLLYVIQGKFSLEKGTQFAVPGQDWQ